MLAKSGFRNRWAGGGGWDGGWEEWQAFDASANLAIVPVAGWGRIRGKENMVPHGTQAQAKGMSARLRDTPQILLYGLYGRGGMFARF